MIRISLLKLEIKSSTESELYLLISKGKYVEECKEELLKRGTPYKEVIA